MQPERKRLPGRLAGSGNSLDGRLLVGHYCRMPDYAAFARFYDELMDADAAANADRVKAAISRHLPAGTTLLELGCGTGAVLARLTTLQALTGLDRSPAMLAIAAGRVPHARLVEADMRAFDLSERFDVVICVYDTLNHLPHVGDWSQVFGRVSDHLVEGGLFIFDVNTIGRLRQLGEGPSWVHDFNGRTLIMNVEWRDDARSVWDIRVFEPDDHGQFALHHERITELGVELSEIQGLLAADFDLVEGADPDGGVPTDESARAYFVYRRRA
jgi:SAM-dependent methyltransferase